MATKFIPEQSGVSGTFHVADEIYLTVGHPFEATTDITTALDAASVTYTDPPGTVPTGRIRIFRPDNNRILLDIGGVPHHVPSNLFFIPTGDELALIEAGYGFERELGPVAGCAIGEQIFPSPYFNDGTGLVSSSNLDALDGSWSTDGDGTSVWTPTSPLIEGTYSVAGILETPGRMVRVGIGASSGGGGIFTIDSLFSTFSGQVEVRAPGATIRVYEPSGLPVALDSLLISRVS
jgi:hypothetical protein